MVFTPTVTELKYLLALVQEKHFAKAAKVCFVSQPTLSIAIKRLEEKLGANLLERSNNNGVLITEFGDKILNYAKNIMLNLEEIHQISLNYQDPYTQPLRLGAIHTVGPYLFPQLITKLLDNEDNRLRLIIEEGFTANLQLKLLGGVLDAIIVAAPFAHPSLTTIQLYSEVLYIILPLKHAWGKIKYIDPQNLTRENLLLLDQGNCFRDQILQICPHCLANDPNAPLNSMIISSSLETIKHMVASGMGISILPHLSCFSNVHHIQIKQFTNPQPRRKILLAYRNEFTRMELIWQLQKRISELPDIDELN
jgi:LysR family hydrogen peroxide-inducible transcriptional activator